VDPGPPLRDVRCFVLVARHLGFSSAAAELRMSQPAVSQAVGRRLRGGGGAAGRTRRARGAPGLRAGTLAARTARRLARRRHHVVTGDIDDFAAALDLVAAGNGLPAAPDPLVRTVRRDDVRFVPLDGAGLRMTYGLAWSPERVSPELMALAQAVQETLWTR
jgi:DNA-binding transcriptional LysR family regulator